MVFKHLTVLVLPVQIYRKIVLLVQVMFRVNVKVMQIIWRELCVHIVGLIQLTIIGNVAILLIQALLQLIR